LTGKTWHCCFPHFPHGSWLFYHVSFFLTFHFPHIYFYSFFLGILLFFLCLKAWSHGKSVETTQSNRL
jgi:hypothetical protein